jgi:hypothetical protein
MKEKEVIRTPPKKTDSVQYDLFSQFVTNDVSKTSNTIEIWESIPKYFLTPRQVEKLRSELGHLDPFKWEYLYKNQIFTIKIQPAMIEQGDGSYKAFFPGITEEIVEEVLKKIFARHSCAVHKSDPKAPESWVIFTLRSIYKELKDVGKTRSISEIKHAIEVMSSCVMSLYAERKEIWRGTILQDLVRIDRQDYIADPDARHVARLSLLISHSIDRLEHRQFNYKRFMACKEQLSRWIYKRLIHRYKQANNTNSYHFMYSELKNSGLLQQATEKDNRKKALSALNELVKKHVIASYEVNERKQRRSILDVKYTIYPSQDFVLEQKSANHRAKEQYRIALNSGLNFCE